MMGEMENYFKEIVNKVAVYTHTHTLSGCPHTRVSVVR